MKVSYFSLAQGGDESARLDKQYAQSLQQCKTCLTYRVPRNAPSIVVRYAPLGDLITFVWDTNLTLIARSLLDVLKSALGHGWQKWFEAAPIQTSDRRPSRFVIFRPTHAVVIRGTENIHYYICPECSNGSYMAFGRRYLVEPIDYSIPLFSAHAGALVLREDVVGRLNLKDTEVVMEQLLVETRPLDGLPVELGIVRK